jgi:hypothetical protein
MLIVEMLLNGQDKRQEVRDNLIGASCSHVLQGAAGSRLCQDSEGTKTPPLEVPHTGGHSLPRPGVLISFRTNPTGMLCSGSVGPHPAGQEPPGGTYRESERDGAAA